MDETRIGAFSDGVIAIIITTMVLDLKVPYGASFNDLIALAPISWAMSSASSTSAFTGTGASIDITHPIETI